MSSQPEDRDLVNGLRANDIRYQHLLVNRYAVRLLPFIMHLYELSYHDAWDVVNLTFEKVIRKIDTFDLGRGVKFTTWITKIAKNTALDKLKQLKKNPEESIQVLEEKGIQFKDPYWDDPETIGTGEGLLSEKLMKKALSCLSETDQTILRGRAHNFEHKEIGSWINKNENAAKVAHHRALKKLKQKYIELIEALEEGTKTRLHAFLGIEDANGKEIN